MCYANRVMLECGGSRRGDLLRLILGSLLVMVRTEGAGAGVLKSVVKQMVLKDKAVSQAG